MKKTINTLNSKGKNLAIKKSEVIEALRDCYDPCCRDRGISVVDMGLIENVKVKDRNVDIDILITTGWCPSVAILFQMMKERVEQFEQVDEVNVQVVWDPVWTMDRLSESARKKLTLPLEELIPLREKRLANQQKGE
jgi:metal-sulfur cluster biosynthetic enzyme|tara:strand:- start:235 stop:645 length:411 start_codon:yes stop_codon:yes gene_type:complete